MIEKFYQNKFIPALAEAIEATEQIYQSQNHVRGEDFLQQFRAVCNYLKRYSVTTDFQLAFFYFNLLRTKFIYQNYLYAVYAYDESLYLKEGIACGTIDLSFLFQPYDRLWKRMLNESRVFIGKISTDEVQDLMLSAAEYFHRYAVEFLRRQIGKAVETEEYQSLSRYREVEIASGEFFEPCDLIYIENNKKQIKTLQRKLKNALKGELQFRDFRSLELSEMSLNNQDFRYADFSDANLDRTKFYSSLLDGVRMRRSQAKEANFTLAMLNDVDFTDADLQGALFGFCVSDCGKNGQNEWRGVGCVGISFANANLHEANFRQSLIVGGEFRGANLQGVCFHEASLFRSRFSEEQIWEGMLSPAQREQIQVF